MAIQVTASWDQGLAFSLQVRGHKLRSDLPPDKGGADQGPTPPELLLAALAACSGMFAAMFANREGLSPEGITAVAEADAASSPMRLENFRVRVRFPHLPEDKRAKALAFMESCLVGNALKTQNQVQIELE